MTNPEAELQLLNSQAQMIAQQLDHIESSLLEIEYVKNALDEMKKTKEGSELLAPLSSGIFVKATAQPVDTLLVNVGNGVVVEKSIADTKALLDERVYEMTGVRETLMTQLQKIEQQLIKLDAK